MGAISSTAPEYTQAIVENAGDYYLLEGSHHTEVLLHRLPGRVEYKIFMERGELSWYEGGRWWSPKFGKRNLRKILAAIREANS